MKPTNKEIATMNMADQDVVLVPDNQAKFVYENPTANHLKVAVLLGNGVTLFTLSDPDRLEAVFRAVSETVVDLTGAEVIAGDKDMVMAAMQRIRNERTM